MFDGDRCPFSDSPGKTRTCVLVGLPHPAHHFARSSTTSGVRSTSLRSWFFGVEISASGVRPPYPDDRLSEIDVSPLEREKLSFAHAGLQREQQERRCGPSGISAKSRGSSSFVK